MVDTVLCGDGSARGLALVLERLVPRPTRPVKRLEQYRTPAELSVAILWRLAVAGRQPRIVYDLGCGTGMLAYTAACMGCGYVVGVDIDPGLLAEAVSSRLHELLPNIDFAAADALHPPLRSVDGLAVMNPPFGIASRRGIDMDFVAEACRLTGWVLSIHDAHTRGLEELASRRCGGSCRVIGEAEFPLPAMYPGHRKKLHYIRVAIIECRRGVDG
ncbi:MAG: methyltransferase domain-containing protein [Crenarchaeota archaeon]|nr:methyltransferase domain-containing protein [Thermoproteota archaeon]